MKEMELRVTTPEGIFYEGSVTAVEFSTTEGIIGVLPGHVPMTVLVKPGTLHIRENSATKTAALQAGFAEILQDKVTILAEAAEQTL